MKKHLEGVQATDIPFIERQVQELLLAQHPELVNYDEVMIFGRRCLIYRLQVLGNAKMLKRVNSNRHEYYLLFLNHVSKTLKMISLPYTAEYIWAMAAA
jgi:hypothetical protein